MLDICSGDVSFLFKTHLLIFIRRPMPPAACFRLCRRDSLLGGVFARSAPFPAYSVSVIVSTGYYLLLAFFFF